MTYNIYFYDDQGNIILERVTKSHAVRNLTIKQLHDANVDVCVFSYFDGMCVGERDFFRNEVFSNVN